jgi:transposase
MMLKNKYVRRSKISEAKFRQMLKLFAYDLDAQTIASLTNLNRNTVNRYMGLMRARIAEFCESQSSFREEQLKDGLDNKAIRADEKSTSANLSRGNGNKGPVIGIRNENGNVYAEIVPNCYKSSLQGVIRGKVDPDRLNPDDGWQRYNLVVDPAYKKQFHVTQGKDETALDRSNLNRIESFWSYAKQHLMKFHGIAESTYYVHLKECEFRFNYRNQDIYSLLLKMFRKSPLS